MEIVQFVQFTGGLSPGVPPPRQTSTPSKLIGKIFSLLDSCTGRSNSSHKATKPGLH